MPRERTVDPVRRYQPTVDSKPAHRPVLARQPVSLSRLTSSRFYEVPSGREESHGVSPSKYGTQLRATARASRTEMSLPGAADVEVL